MASKVSQSKSDLTKRDFRAIVLILFKLQKTRVEIYESLQEHFPDLAPSLTTVERWYREFIHGNFVLEDAPRSGRPNILHNEENVNEMLDLITKDPHITCAQFANGSSRAVSEILTGDETWIYHYDPEIKRISKEWVEEDAPPPTKVRRARSVGKQMWAMFSDLVDLSKLLLSRIERLILPTGTLQCAYPK
ncbi:hypothetical protein LOD99_7920 [Oopsacas minuta]|uniref:Mos1 transposase HTH domain-containing protein n=1 Tax=Oopsacas minuta TaxID=111878 RepID=A0AAV7JJN2_9METZ|nr:hypothetical protein LOD99_7920 [Oopsacas minuta]